ncbi:MAG: hypothetical protein WCO56_04265 [Verrucomicrobiota bacterium]
MSGMGSASLTSISVITVIVGLSAQKANSEHTHLPLGAVPMVYVL